MKLNFKEKNVLLFAYKDFLSENTTDNKNSCLTSLIICVPTR